MAKVSFVLPAYKRRFLKEAIASILVQTYRDFELIVVDDCSPEGLKEIVDQFHDARLAYYRNERNLGGKDLIAAWNKAMEYATGEFCVLAADDDVYHPDYLMELISLSEKYPTVDVFHCRMVCIDGDGRWKYIGEPRSEWESAIEMLYSRGVKRLNQRAPDFMFRLSAFKNAGGFVWTPKAWYTDDATWINLSYQHGAACSSRVLFYWRESGENITSVFHDAPEKLLAHKIFREWVHSFILKLKPTNELEENMLDVIKRDIDRVIDNLSSWVLGNTPFGVWWHVMLQPELLNHKRARFIYERLSRKVTLSRWLGKVWRLLHGCS